MAIPQNAEAVSTYIIYRDIAPGEPFDPTSPLVFFPPKGSDELFDALRIAFPLAKTHSERMRDAIIQYLIEERQDEQTFQNASPATTTIDNMPTPWPSMSSDTTFSSPELLNFGTPTTSFANSPQPQAAHMTRQASTATSSEASPPTLDAMTGVFSVSASEQPKQRMRRKMTEAEKIEYRKRRIVKACDKCAKRKRKCPHNQAEMETIPMATNKSSARISKSIAPRSSKSITPPSAQQTTFFDPSAMDDMAFLDNLDPNTMAPIEDFNMFDDQFPEFDMSLFGFDNIATSGGLFTPDAASPMQLNWPHDPTEAFELQDPALPSPHNASDKRPALQSHTNLQGRGSGSQRLPLAVDIPQLTRSGTSLDSSASSDAQSSWEGYGLEGGLLVDGGQRHVGGGDGLLWEHLRTGQIEKPVPTHTAHIHGVNSGGSGELHDVGRPQSSTTPTSLPQTVSRPNGTKKALNLQANSTTTALIANPGEQAVGQDGSQHQQDHAKTQSGLPRSGELANMAQPDVNAAQPSRRARNARVAVSSSAVSRSSQPRGGSQSAALAANLLLQPPTGPEYGRAQLRQRQQQQRRPERTLGEGLSETADPSLQLYMTRRRTNMTINTFCGANMNAGTPGGGTTGGAQLQARSSQGQAALHTRQQYTTTSSSAANGGAYPRPQGEAAKPKTALARPLADLHSGDTADIQQASPKTTSRGGQAPQQGRPSDHMLCRDHHGRQQTGTTTEVPKLAHGTETNRYRDHHGRTLFSAALLMLFVSISWLASSSAALAPSLLLLSFLQIHSSDADIVQCTGKNSWWLSTFASQQLGSSFGVWQAKMHGRNANWFEGLMYPHGLSPLRTVAL